MLPRSGNTANTSARGEAPIPSTLPLFALPLSAAPTPHAHPRRSMKMSPSSSTTTPHTINTTSTCALATSLHSSAASMRRVSSSANMSRLPPPPQSTRGALGSARLWGPSVAAPPSFSIATHNNNNNNNKMDGERVMMGQPIEVQEDQLRELHRSQHRDCGVRAPPTSSGDASTPTTPPRLALLSPVLVPFHSSLMIPSVASNLSALHDSTPFEGTPATTNHLNNSNSSPLPSTSSHAPQVQRRGVAEEADDLPNEELGHLTLLSSSSTQPHTRHTHHQHHHHRHHHHHHHSASHRISSLTPFRNISNNNNTAMVVMGESHLNSADLYSASTSSRGSLATQHDHDGTMSRIDSSLTLERGCWLARTDSQNDSRNIFSGVGGGALSVDDAHAPSSFIQRSIYAMHFESITAVEAMLPGESTDITGTSDSAPVESSALANLRKAMGPLPAFGEEDDDDEVDVVGGVVVVGGGVAELSQAWLVDQRHVRAGHPTPLPMPPAMSLVSTPAAVVEVPVEERESSRHSSVDDGSLNLSMEHLVMEDLMPSPEQRIASPTRLPPRLMHAPPSTATSSATSHAHHRAMSVCSSASSFGTSSPAHRRGCCASRNDVDVFLRRQRSPTYTLPANLPEQLRHGKDHLLHQQQQQQQQHRRSLDTLTMDSTASSMWLLDQTNRPMVQLAMPTPPLMAQPASEMEMEDVLSPLLPTSPQLERDHLRRPLMQQQHPNDTDFLATGDGSCL